jgi:hypothetical protein
MTAPVGSPPARHSPRLRQTGLGSRSGVPRLDVALTSGFLRAASEYAH